MHNKPDITDLSPIDNLEIACHRLRYFYFISAQGGIANDGDSFQAWIKFRGKEDFLGKMERLGIKIKKANTINGSTGDRPIKSIPQLEEPGFVTIDEVRCLIMVHKRIMISICGTGTDNPYSLTKADYNACLRLESIFDQCNFEKDIDYEIENFGRCFYKKAKA